MDACLGLPYRDYTDLLFSRFEQHELQQAEWLKLKKDTIAMNFPPTLELKDFSGTYQNEVYGNMNIIAGKQGLTIHFSHHSITGKLEALGGNRFLCTYSEPIF